MKLILVLVVITFVAVQADRAGDYLKDMKGIEQYCKDLTKKDDVDDSEMKKCMKERHFEINPHKKPEFKAQFKECEDGDDCKQLQTDLVNGEQAGAGHKLRLAKYHVCMIDCVCGKDLKKCKDARK